MPRSKHPYGSRSGAGNRLEWIGGRFRPPFFITDRDEPYRPWLVLWLEAGSGLVVGHEMAGPEEVEGAVGRALRSAMARPLAGPVRQPDRVRVADRELVAELKRVVPEVPIVVAPTPELDEMFEFMLDADVGVVGGDHGLLTGGAVSADLVAGMFRAASLLYGLAPWNIVDESQVLRADIPALDVDGACLSIIGAEGVSRGVLMFPSLAGYERFLEAAGRLEEEGGRHPDFGTDWISLSFEVESDLPVAMLREREVHDWPVADRTAFPVVSHHDEDGAVRPPVERDVKIVSACAEALCVLLVRHPDLFDPEGFEPVCESFFDNDDLEVRFTAPYEAFSLFEVSNAPVRDESARPAVGRNDPCPCGSGRKYKKCHLAADTRPSKDARREKRVHDLDGRIAVKLRRFAERLGPKWRAFERVFVDAENTTALSVPWSLYHHEVLGATAAETYLKQRGRRLERAERKWLEAQRGAWLSVWEVVGVERGEHLDLRDRLTGETRRVVERSGSETLQMRDAILARVVDHAGMSLLCGAHPQPLRPLDAERVVDLARRHLRRKRAVPVERLRPKKVGRYLIRRWEETVAEMYARPAMPSRLQNTDGHDLLLTTDHFEIAPGATPEVEARLGAMEGVRPPEDDAPGAYPVLRPDKVGGTLIGTLEVAGTRLRIETNSRERADDLRRRVEAACGERLRHRGREHADPLSSRAERRSGAEAMPDLSSPELQGLMLDYKRRHYEDWLDQELPALDGNTPRHASRTAKGRSAVDLLLRAMENAEQCSPGGAAFDFRPIRRELGLDP